MSDLSVSLSLTSSSNALIPSLQFYCQQGPGCSYAPASLADSCKRSIFANLTHYSERVSWLDTTRCNEIVLRDGSSLSGGVSCLSTEDAGLQESPPDSLFNLTGFCPGVVYYYRSGRSRGAVCPAGTEMVMSVFGNVGSIEYILTPSSNTALLGELAPECRLVNGAYRCQSGSVTLRFTSTENGSMCDPQDCRGDAYGRCEVDDAPLDGDNDGCFLGPDPGEPLVARSFTADLRVTSSSNSLRPYLEYYCRQGPTCTVVDPTISAACSQTSFENSTQYISHLQYLPGFCNQVTLIDASNMFAEYTCQDSAQVCGASVLNIRRDVQNKQALCPSGSEMVVAISGAVGNINYIVTTSAGVELTGALPPGCEFVAGSYRCSSGPVSLSFTQTGNPCIDGKDCSAPSDGLHLYGRCSPSTPELCDRGPTPQPPLQTDEFEVELKTTSSSNSLTPAMEWYCLYGSNGCTAVPDSIQANSCAQNTAANLHEFISFLSDFSGGCNQITLQNGTALYENGIACGTGELDEACTAVLFRYSNGRGKSAFCPSGTEMVISSAGNPGDVVYLFEPVSGAAELVGELPADCILIGGQYRCEASAVTMRFTHRAKPCDSKLGGRCPTPTSGTYYGKCDSRDECLNQVLARDLVITSSEPSPSQTEAPNADPSSHSPSVHPSSSPSAHLSAHPSSSPSVRPSPAPSLAPNARPSSAPSLTPSARPSAHPSSSPSARPSSAPSLTPSARPSAHPSSSPSAHPSSDPSLTSNSRTNTMPSVAPSVDPSATPTATATTQPGSEALSQSLASPPYMAIPIFGLLGTVWLLYYQY